MTTALTAQLSEIMTREVLGIAPTATLDAAARLMAEENVSSLLVSEGGKALGIITESNIVRAMHDCLPGDTPASAIMAQPLISAPPELDLLQARKLVEQHRIRHLLIVDAAGKTLGIVSETDFRLALGTNIFRHLRNLASVMERKIPSLSPQARLDEAIACMVDCGSDYLIVTDNDKPLGILTERDIPRLLRQHPQPQAVRLEQAMNTPVRGISIGASVTTALEAMNRHRLRHMAVLDGNGLIQGVISQRRLLEQLALHQFEAVLEQARQERDRLRLEAHLKLSLDAVGGGSWEYQHESDRHSISAALRQLLRDPAEAAPLTLAGWCERIHPEERAAFSAVVAIAESGATPRHLIEYRIRGGDGSWIWVEDRGCAIEYRADGRPALTIGILTDISKRRHEQARIESERNRLGALLKMLPEMVWLKDGDGIYRECNPLAGRLFGCSPEAVIGHSDRQLLSAEMAERLSEQDRLTIAQNGTQRFEEILHFPDGSSEHVETLKTPIYNSDGSLLGVLGIAHDITEREGSRQRIAAQNRALRLMSGVAQALVRHHDERAMLTDICTQVVDIGGYRMAWIGAAVDDAARSVVPLAEAGCGEDYLASLDITWEEGSRGNGPTGRAIRSGMLCLVQDIDNDPSFAPWRASAQALGYRASIALPLRIDGAVVGAFNLYATTANAFSDEELTLLGNLASELGLGMAMQRSRRALLSSEANLRQAQHLARLGHYEFAPQADRWNCSPELAEIFGIDAGYPRTTASWLALVHPEDRERIGRDLQTHLLRQDQVFDNRYRIVRHGDGKVTWVHDTGALDIDDKGAVTRMFGTVQDVSERIGLEQELRESESLLQEAQAIAYLGSWRIDIASGTGVWSDEAYRIIGKPRGSAVSTDDYVALIHPEDRARVEGEWRAALAGAPYNCVHRIIVDGHPRWLRSRAQFRFSPSGEPLSAVGALQDISEQRSAEESLRKLSLAIEQTPHSIIITNTRQEIEYVNEAFVNNTGYLRAEVIGRTPALLRSGLTPAATYTTLRQALADGEVWHGEFVNRRRDGSHFEALAIISPVRQPDGRLTHFLATEEDVSEKKRIQ
ncbi:MAG: PAS domain S-box protein, partial [Betaproteobacteria bacterium]|nr:PAS domain S-box protein [Betaproteobacteria bacterium]